jgi:hypothetical protein
MSRRWITKIAMVAATTATVEESMARRSMVSFPGK